MVKRRKPFRKISETQFLFLPPEIQDDVSVCLKHRLERIYDISDGERVWTDDVRAILERLDPAMPILFVKTSALVKADREIYEETMLEYKAVWESDVSMFPPVVIDSEDEDLLCEGGHRSFSAHAAGVKEIEAVDVASIDAKLIARELGLPV